MGMSNKATFQSFGDRLVSTLRARIPKASGRTAEGVRMEVTEESMKIFAPAQLKALIDGRGPSQKAPPMASILEWMDFMGIEGKPYQRKDGSLQDQFKADQSLAFLIARKIKNKGYAGNESIMKEWFTDSLLRDIAAQIGAKARTEYLSDVLKAAA